jgi:leader peptidase (prepilin peptidase)/N-methyltransferase
VELLTALFFAYFVALEGRTPAAAKDCLFAAIMIGLIFSDLDTRLLPDEFTIGGLGAGLVLAFFVPLPQTFFFPGLHFGRLSIGAGGASVAEAFWLLRWGYEKVRHVEGAGLGDVKMIAMMGAFLGIGHGLLALTAGSIVGSVIGLAYIKIQHKDPATYELPMASFLGVGGLLITALSVSHLGWYQQLL